VVDWIGLGIMEAMATEEERYPGGGGAMKIEDFGRSSNYRKD
jgi:hypothetical protein